MDPLHPLVPIQPPAPTPPEYNRVQRIERDPQGDSGPDWERDGDDGSEEEQPPFEDDYDPDWSDPAAAEPYGPDGAPHDSAEAVDMSARPVRKWDPRTDGERRSRPRDDGAETDDDDAGPETGPHIDIGA